MKFKATPHITRLPAGATLADPWLLLATWFGSGLVRPAPGTMGTLAALPLGYLISYCWGQGALAVAAFVVFAIGVVAANRYGEKSGVIDDQSIVIDEAAGLWIAAIPAENNIWLWLVAFLLFRLFDITKPWPASYFDEGSRGGFDVMMDDVIAGVFALLGVSIAALVLLP